MSSRKLLFSLAKQYPRLMILNVILGFSGAVFNGVGTTLIIPVLLGFLGQPIASKNAPSLIQGLLTPFQGVSEEQGLYLMTGAILVMLLLKNLATYANALVSGGLRRSLSADLRKKGLKILLDVDLDYFVKTGIGDIINSLNNEIFRVGTAITTVAKAITVCITALVFIGVLLWTSWQLTILSTGLLLVVALVNQYSIARSKSFGQQLSDASKQYSTNVLDLLSGMRLVRASATEQEEYRRIAALIDGRERADFKSQANSAFIEPVSEMAGMIALLLIVLMGRTFLSSQLESVSTVLLVYLFVLFRTLPLMSQLNAARSQLANAAPSVHIVFEFLRQDTKPFMGNGTIAHRSLQEGIHFNHLSLAYPGQENRVLKDVNLYLPRSTTLALVGSSGAGKSTLADLLPRFYDPTEGSILIDGVDLRDLDIRTLRRTMGIVSQDTFLFNTTIWNNIAYGSQASHDEVIAAAKRANALEFIERLPQGWNTEIGDRGVLLSGGQRQRIAIARALLQNPEILILDEATSALDTVSERLVQEAIDHLSRDRTTLVIAHRLSTVQKADQIAVMDQGRVVELGTHEELLAKQGYYAKLCEMQLSDQHQPPSQQHWKKLSNISYELRSRLNQLVGSLSLVVDEMIDSPEEYQEWTQEAYDSTLNLIKSLESLEQDTNKQWVNRPNP
ncbi:MAG: ABC transporter ATP-binding protein/permease [Oculatellaceae cyanobacterium Prado106]|nr:ABC transporter ATP-binding protein/permease [Oculatellaceae cyanobacterium Prado106]